MTATNQPRVPDPVAQPGDPCRRVGAGMVDVVVRGTGERRAPIFENPDIRDMGLVG
jgi:hypothetical protein